MDKLLEIFASLGWSAAPPALAKALGSSVLALASFSVPGATWRIRIGKRVSHLERRAHGTPTGRASCGHWESVGAIDTPRTVSKWRQFADALTGEALAFESNALGALTDSPLGSQHTRRGAADGGEFSGQSHGRGRVLRSNPSRLDAFGFAPSSGYRLLSGRSELIDANPETTLKCHRERVGLTLDAKVRKARKARRNARRKAQRAGKVG